MATLLFKFFTLGLKQAAKPLARRFESYVLNHPTFQGYVLGVAQKLHGWEVTRMTELKDAESSSSRSSSKGGGNTGGAVVAKEAPRRVFVGKLSDEKALHLAANLVSETFLFVVGAGIVVFEYERTRRKEVEKKVKEESFRRLVDEMHERERQVWSTILPDLQQQGLRQTEIIEQMARRIDELEGHVKGMEDARAAARQAKFLGLFSLGGGGGG